MHADQAQDPKLLAHYEGLIRKTASLYVDSCEEDYDDICQIFRIKVWKALLSFTPERVKKNSKLSPDQQRDRFVFACLKNQAKDLVKKVKLNWAYIEDFAPDSGSDRHGATATDRFEARYLQATEEQVFATIEEGAPLIPSSLDAVERRVIALLYLDFKQTEISEVVEMSRTEVATVVAGIREKMADWKPDALGNPIRIGAEPEWLPVPLAA